MTLEDARARSLREEKEDRKFSVTERWQITWRHLMIWQYLFTGCITVRAIHHLYGFIALGNTSTPGFSCLVSWQTASYSYFRRARHTNKQVGLQVLWVMSRNLFCLPQPFEAWDVDPRNCYFAIHHQRFGERFLLIKTFVFTDVLSETSQCPLWCSLGVAESNKTERFS